VNTVHLGEIIYNYRQENHVSMEEFAKLAGLSKPYISMLEKNQNSRTGKPIVPSVLTLKKVARVLNMTFDQIIRALDDGQEIDLTKTPQPVPGVVLDPDEKIILALYKQLDRDDKIEIRGEIKGMLRADKYRDKQKEDTAG
jgi:transcriptional regulator with XRE-family HTH domain